MFFSGQDVLREFSNLRDTVGNIRDDDIKFEFIDRCAKHLQDELGWSVENSTDLAIAIKYTVNEDGYNLPEYDEIEKCFFDILVVIIRRFEERFPSATVHGFIAAGSAMEFQLEI